MNTRLRRLDADEFDAIILAAAGLIRLNLHDRIRSYLSIEQSLPAPGQGILGIECRAEDSRVAALIAPLQHELSFIAATAERALCRRLGGGCHAPVGAYAEVQDGRVDLRGLVASPTGVTVMRARQTDDCAAADALGQRVAEELLQLGANDILKACVPKS